MLPALQLPLSGAGLCLLCYLYESPAWLFFFFSFSSNQDEQMTCVYSSSYAQKLKCLFQSDSAQGRTSG